MSAEQQTLETNHTERVDTLEADLKRIQNNLDKDYDANLAIHEKSRAAPSQLSVGSGLAPVQSQVQRITYTYRPPKSLKSPVENKAKSSASTPAGNSVRGKPPAAPVVHQPP